jgi:hypothetical protein
MYKTYVYGCTVESVTNAIDNFSKEHNYNNVCSAGSFSSKNSYIYFTTFPNVLASKIAVYACAAAVDRSLTVGWAGAAGGSSCLA